MSRLVSIVLLFVSCSINAQDTLPAKRKSFSKQLFIACEIGRRNFEYSQNNPHPLYPNTWSDTQYGIPLINLKISHITNYTIVETGLNFFSYGINFYNSLKYQEFNLEGEELLLTSRAAINTLFFLNNSKRIQFFIGSSYYYQPYYDYLTHINPYVGYVKRSANVISFDCLLKWKRYSISYQRWSNLNNKIKNFGDFFTGINHIATLSYYHPLYREKVALDTTKHHYHKQRFSVFTGLHPTLITFRNSSAFGTNTLLDYSECFFVNTLPVGFAYRYKNILQQLSVKVSLSGSVGSVFFSTEYSVIYNLRPFFNGSSTNFTGIEMGVHYGQHPFFDTEYYGDFHLGILHIVKDKVYMGISNYLFKPLIKESSSSTDKFFLPDGSYISSNVELKFGYYFGLIKK